MRFEVGLFRNDEDLTAARGFFVQVCCDRADAAADRDAAERARSARSDPAWRIRDRAFRVGCERRRGAAGALDDGAWRRRYPGVHAGRHLRHGQGDEPRRAAGARRADRARQHVSPVAAAGARRDRRARRAAPLHGLARADPHRFRRFPGFQPGRACARSPRRACSSSRRSTAMRAFSRPKNRCASSACSIPTSSWCSTSARRIRRASSRRAIRCR